MTDTGRAVRCPSPIEIFGVLVSLFVFSFVNAIASRCVAMLKSLGRAKGKGLRVISQDRKDSGSYSR